LDHAGLSWRRKATSIQISSSKESPAKMKKKEGKKRDISKRGQKKWGPHIKFYPNALTAQKARRIKVKKKKWTMDTN